MAEHTPGPWEPVSQHDFHRFTIRDVLSRIIATTPGNANTTDQRLGSPYRAEVNKANAQVMAAAPELLDALEWALDVVEDNVDAADAQHDREFMAAWQQAQDAHTKAKRN